MNEIEKMYKNAGIIPRRNWWCRRFDETSIADCDGIFNGEKECSKCEYGYIKSKKYLPFTIGKQIELIKWIIAYEPYLNLSDLLKVSAFEESLANLINIIWQDLSPKEKQQIKEILE